MKRGSHAVTRWQKRSQRRQQIMPTQRRWDTRPVKWLTSCIYIKAHPPMSKTKTRHTRASLKVYQLHGQNTPGDHIVTVRTSHVGVPHESWLVDLCEWLTTVCHCSHSPHTNRQSTEDPDQQEIQRASNWCNGGSVAQWLFDLHEYDALYAVRKLAPSKRLRHNTCQSTGQPPNIEKQLFETNDCSRWESDDPTDWSWGPVRDSQRLYLALEWDARCGEQQSRTISKCEITVGAAFLDVRWHLSGDQWGAI